jgi:hypothetical protein
MSLFRRTVARFEGAKVVDSTAEYEALADGDLNLPVGSREEDDEDDAEADLMAMSTSIGSLRERERELNLSTSGLDASISSLREGEVERGPETMGEVEPVVNATFWAVWKVNSMYNIAVMIIYIVTLVRHFSAQVTFAHSQFRRRSFPQLLPLCNPSTRTQTLKYSPRYTSSYSTPLIGWAALFARTRGFKFGIGRG